MAARTSASQTKSITMGAAISAGAGGAETGGGAGAGALSRALRVVLPDRKRSTTWAASEEAAAASRLTVPIPRAARYRSTAADTMPRSTDPAPAAAADMLVSMGASNASLASRTAYASRLTLMRLSGPTLSEVALPAAAPQPRVIAGCKFVVIPVEPCGEGVL